MTLHAARLDQSPRLQRVHALLARVCAVNAIIAELRVNGDHITCRQARSPSGERLWLYQMRQSPEQAM